MGDNRLAGTEIADSVIDLIGNTPLVRLKRVSELEGLSCVLAMKMETSNPGGSSKDRPALEMILQAERDGLLQPGGTIVEPTSGNTGVGLAVVAAQRGYHCVFVMTDKVAPEKISLLKAYGAEVVVCPVAVEPDDPASYYSVAERLTDELSAFRPNQYANPANPRSHELTTGPELWRQTAGRITHFVAGAGTCGSITGTARYLKAMNPDVRIIAADPEGSVFSGGSGRPYLVEGVGEDFLPAAWQPELYNEIIAISDEESFLTARRVSRAEGILIGGSGGMAVAAAIRVAKRAAPDDIVVVLNPDSGRGYLSRVFDDEWMANFGFVRECESCVGAVLDTRGAMAELLYVNPGQHVREAVELMKANGISQLPVCKNTPPFANAEVSGSVDELDLMEAISRDPGVLDMPVERVMGPRLPTIGVGQTIELAVKMLEAAPALLVLSGGRPLAVITRTDILSYYEAAAVEAVGGDAHGATLEAAQPPPARPVDGEGAPSTWEESGVGAPLGAAQPPAKGFETRAIHAGQRPDAGTGAVVPPISLATTFAQREVGVHQGYEYSRSGNPTRTALETCLASLEGARHGLAFASGLAAEDTVLRAVAPGGRVVLGNDAYGGTYRLIAHVWGAASLGTGALAWNAVDLTDVDALAADWPSGTTVVWLETPTNPLLTCVDIAAVAEVAHANGALVVADNTFATPYLQNPLPLGADVVVHSATKYLGGHSDVVGGFVAVDDDELAERLRYLQNAAGAVPAPFDCYLVLRGVKTLGVRMDRHCSNARAVVDLLVRHRAVERVYYPQLHDHPGHAAAARQMADYGGMVSFTVHGGEPAARRVVSATEVFTLAESLGAVESLIEHPAAMTHASAADSPLAVPANLVRLSVGIESSADLVADLEQALDTL